MYATILYKPQGSEATRGLWTGNRKKKKELHHWEYYSSFTLFNSRDHSFIRTHYYFVSGGLSVPRTANFYLRKQRMWSYFPSRIKWARGKHDQELTTDWKWCCAEEKRCKFHGTEWWDNDNIHADCQLLFPGRKTDKYPCDTKTKLSYKTERSFCYMMTNSSIHVIIFNDRV